MSGLSSTGFDKATLVEIKADIEDDERSLISESVNVQATAILGVLNGVIADILSENWDLAEEVYNMLNPDSAEGTALDNLSALTGVTRLAATQGTATVSLVGTAATVVTAASQISINSYVWELDSNATITAAAAWGAGGPYNVGDYVENDTPDRIYYCTVAGTSAGAGGPTGTGSAIVDNTVTWRYVGEGAAVIEGAFTAVDYGDDPTAYSGNAATIDTPISGWAHAQFTVDATIGLDEETDAALRLRREQGLQATGNATRDAIRADVLAVTGVTEAYVFVNDTNATVGSLPPHSFEVVVLGGADNDIAQGILDSKSAGIETYGTDSGTATDSEGNSHTMEFTRASEIDIYVSCTVTTDADTYPSDGDDQIKAALVTFGNTLGIDDDVIYTSLYEYIYSVSGVLDVTALTTGTAPAPVGTVNITIGDHEKSDWDTSQIVVTS